MIGRASTRKRGLSFRLQLTLSYAAFIVVVGAAFAVVGFLVLRFVPEGNLLVIDGGAPAPARSDLLEVFVRYAAIALLLLAVLGLGGGWFLAGRMLRPLTLITAAATAARDGSLDHRIRMRGRRNELADLADTFDQMLEQLSDAFQAHERFAANASHELRTPLAVTSMMLEVAARHPEQQDYPVLVERLRLTNDRAVSLTESLLRLADVNAVDARSTSVDLAPIARELIAEKQADADARGVTITAEIETCVVHGDPVLLRQLLDNLVDNTIRHSGIDGTARIQAHHDPSHRRIVLRIESTGATFDAVTAGRLAEPFLRGGGRAADRTDGHGLGLALVDRIAAVHHGSLALAPRPHGGLVVTLELPARG